MNSLRWLPIAASLLLTLVPAAAQAGPNADGTIVVHDADLQFCFDDQVCGMGVVPGSCDEVDVRLDSSGSIPQVWKVYASFPAQSAPRLKGMTFGVHYGIDEFVLISWGPCIGDPNNGAAEYPEANWPGPDTGTTIVFQYTQTTPMVECYWFGGYAYYGGPAQFALAPHPNPALGGNFGDDSIPSLLDPIAGYGALGFNTEGVFACPCDDCGEGACCLGAECVITEEAACQGEYQGDDVPCDPNPCDVPMGACCLGFDCLVMAPEDCMEQGGAYIGDYTDCDPLPCEPYGACCDEGYCYETDEPTCLLGGGVFMGNHVRCEDVDCMTPVQRSTWGRIKSSYR